MAILKTVFGKALIKNTWVILGVTILAFAWLVEKSSIKSREDEIESKRLAWEQYRVNNTNLALISSKFETMRLIDIATSPLQKDSTANAQILLQLRFALFDQLNVGIAREESLYLLESDPIDDTIAKRLMNKRVELANALNSKDINKLYFIYKRDSDESFNKAEIKSKEYVKDFYILLNRHKKAQSGYLVLYILGSLLVVFQKIKDTIRQEKGSLESSKPNQKSVKKK